MAASKAAPNGSADAPIEVRSSIPPVVGINFGNSYASIAVVTKEGLAECIANEDGERQIACAVAFHGEEIYIGSQAKHQLVKNAHNTITGFRNLLGKRFSEVPQNEQPTSAPVIPHPDDPSIPAYEVSILQPAPLPLPSTTTTTTPAASHAPTPRSEPIPASRVLTVADVTTLFLKSLLQSATDFLGTPVLGAVLSVPASFTQRQRDALRTAAAAAGIRVLQLLEECGAVAATTTTEVWRASHAGLGGDRMQLVVDLGASSLALTLLSIRDGLGHVLAGASHEDVRGEELDEKLMRYFAREFTKKTKTGLTVCPAVQAHDKRAEAKLRLAVEHTKRTLAASAGAATCSVESLKDGLDFTGSINRMRFDMEARGVYARVAERVRGLLGVAGVDGHYVDEIVYVGGSACLPGLDEHLCLEGGVDGERVGTPFKAGTVAGGGVGDPTEVVARGCALEAALLVAVGESGAFEEGSRGWSEVAVLGRTIGLVFPGREGEEGMGGVWIPVLLTETSVPARRSVVFGVGVGVDGRFGFEVWEVDEGIRIERVKAVGEEEEEEEEVKYKTVMKAEGGYLGKIEGLVDTSGGTVVQMEVRMMVGKEGGVVIEAREGAVVVGKLVLAAAI